MKLSESDAAHYFRLMWGLQNFVNRELNIYPDVKSISEYEYCESDEKVIVRNALYKNIDLIDKYIDENPENLTKDDLAIVAGWKNYIGGDFYIERFLKKYTIFIQDDDVYGVLGLYNAFNEHIHKSYLPRYVRAILLPFKGQIIYDGFFNHHNVYFGSGVARGLKEIYMRAKQNNRIIESLEKTAKKKSAKSKKKLKNWKPEIDKLVSQAKKLKGSADSPAIYTPAFSLVKASTEFAQLALSDNDDPEVLEKALKKIRRACNRAQTVIDRDEYYY